MKLFGWKSTGRDQSRPARSLVSLARGFGAVSLGEWPRSYEAQVRDGYLNNAVAQRAVRLVAEGAASVPVVASDPQASALVAATTAGQSLIETLATQLLLHGNGYVQLILAPDGMVCELFALRPDRVTIEADARGWPAAFRYKAGEAVTRFGTNEIVHLRTHHPLDDHYGLGCLGAASGAIAAHNAATKWNKALLDNAARPSGALVHEAAETLSAEQFDRLRSELAASFAGAENAGRPMLLEGGLKWQSMSLSPADMDFIELKAAAAREIALAFGVPSVLLGLPGDATYANYREANKALWRQTILPMAGKILDAIAEGLQSWLPGVTLKIDLDAVPALAEDRERLWAQLGAADFLTVEEKRAAVGLPGLGEGRAEPIEVKFNPWHDPDSGRFANKDTGRRYEGNGGDYGGGGSHGNIELPPKPQSVRRLGSGGSFGGGGASGSFSKPVSAPKSRPQVPAPAPKPKPKQELVKPSAPSDPANPARIRLPSVRTTNPDSATRRISANGYNFEIDAADRTRRVFGTLRIEPTQKRSKTEQLRAGGPDRRADDQGGHFIAREFGGPREKFNHFAQNGNFNRSAYRELEISWRGQIKKGKAVRVNIVPMYEGRSQRPHVLVVTYSTGTNWVTQRFPNSRKGK